MLENVNVVDAYHISFNTYLIEPIKHGDKLFSHIYDKNGEVIVERKPIYIVRKSCHDLGTNYNATRIVAKRFFGNEKHKLPIIIFHDFGIPCVFFPLLSPTSSNNIWIGLHAITNIRRHHDCTQITLKNGKEILLQLNFPSFCSQYVNATMLQKYATKQRSIIQNELSF